ncbi:hypothetical protein RFI_33733, partial [Reticulomyxa filosa]
SLKQKDIKKWKIKFQINKKFVIVSVTLFYDSFTKVQTHEKRIIIDFIYVQRKIFSSCKNDKNNECNYVKDNVRVIYGMQLSSDDLENNKIRSLC